MIQRFAVCKELSTHQLIYLSWQLDEKDEIDQKAEAQSLFDLPKVMQQVNGSAESRTQGFLDSQSSALPNCLTSGTIEESGETSGCEWSGEEFFK